MEAEKVINPVVRLVAVEADYVGQRIDNFLMRELKGVPKSRIYNLLRRGEVRVNKSRAKPDYKLVEGDIVRVPPVRVAVRDEAAVPVGLDAGLRSAILYEDEGLIIINKPSGLAVHGGSGISLGLIEALRQMYPEQRHLELVHRLDRDTSGCVMVAKRRSVLKQLHELLRARKGVDKRYLALVAGKWPARKQQVNAPLQKNVLSSGERMVRVELEGKKSVTEFTLLRRVAGASLIEARPVTGRTHQIRVHCQYAGYPILGDDKYGDDAADAHFRKLGLKRLFLHAHSLVFTLDGRRISVTAPLAPELEKVLEVAGSDLSC
ncbi:MAG: 23S rRNA pseudouridine(955/2504/2580) synthase RluC [Zhongshania sp.]|uniref:23S rRNA pseudouridine(955/2504/2580) synthase RluC n=1 Tax=Zhongshania sp. TaxID=1971902 RepID=UPI0026126D97|nr:23S rRNA pseudouridine(955/2504/2580) synthase RluC [Zhongshania sp.]MDF1691639.1 23S rRNA pseudouridine(955/2504/2580) synthase RluC [Zhongshania sp.]